MFVKIHNSYRTIVSICDKELINQKFEQDNMQLDVKEDFFKGEQKTEQEVLRIIEQAQQEDATFNIVGKKAIQTALKAGIINKQGIKQIQGVPVALVLL